MICEPPQVKLRTLTLAGPDRLVVDVMVRGSAEERPVVAKAAPAPPARPRVPPAATPSREAAPPPVRKEVPAPPADRASRPAPAPSPPAKDVPRAAPAPSEPDAKGDATPLTIVLDPGHGGHDTGAIGPTGLMEKDVVLDLFLRLRRLLQSRLGVSVLMSRSEDVFVALALQQRRQVKSPGC